MGVAFQLDPNALEVPLRPRSMRVELGWERFDDSVRYHRCFKSVKVENRLGGVSAREHRGGPRGEFASSGWRRATADLGRCARERLEGSPISPWKRSSPPACGRVRYPTRLYLG